ncbi:hypothetical protein PoB_006556600, partial [Plakobranchus ocellatus]
MPTRLVEADAIVTLNCDLIMNISSKQPNSFLWAFFSLFPRASFMRLKNVLFSCAFSRRLCLWSSP